jgi:vacuolar protein sorting-associated protein 13A/C
MLSGVVSSLVTKYIGEFVELSPEKLQIGLTAGDVDLRDLKFKPEALRDLNLPITVRRKNFFAV